MNHWGRITTRAAAVIMVTLGAAACSGGGGEAAGMRADTSGVADNAPAATLQGVAALLTDNNVLALLDTGYAALIQIDSIAVQHANDPRVQKWASSEFSEHSQARSAIGNLVTGLHITLAMPDRRPLRDDRKALADLQSKTGTEFDKAYLDASIRLHDDMLKDVDSALHGKAAPAVRTFLVETQTNERTAVKTAHELRTPLA